MVAVVAVAVPEGTDIVLSVAASFIAQGQFLIRLNIDV